MVKKRNKFRRRDFGGCLSVSGVCVCAAPVWQVYVMTVCSLQSLVRARKKGVNQVSGWVKNNVDCCGLYA